MMTQRPPVPSVAAEIARRFEGPAGRALLIDKLRNQYILENNNDVVNLLIDKAKLKFFEPDDIIIKQGETDTDVLFIIVGRVVLFKNEIEVERQVPGSVIGEIGAVDAGSYRSVTIKASEPTVVASVSQADFNLIADKYPFLWKRLAIEISDRLRRRETLQPRRIKARVFIASSNESRSIAEALSNLVASA
jgi:CRP/FNR family cyclic AMP-dependent transcriptional regulator